MKNMLATYYLGATIMRKDVVTRIQKYSDDIFSIFGKDCIIKTERHITILPPFYADYQTASLINMKCAKATLLSNHPLVTTVFSIEEIQVMSWRGVAVVHFPVRIHRGHVNDCGFVEYVLALRKRFKEIGLKFVETIPDEYKPHITVLIGENLKRNSRLQAIIEKSKAERPLFFNSNYPTLYTKYEDLGWQTLTRDPAFAKQ